MNDIIIFFSLGMVISWTLGYWLGWRMRAEQEEINRENYRAYHVGRLDSMSRHPAGKKLRVVEG